MYIKPVFKMMVVLALTAFLLPTVSATPAQAATAAIGSFYAGCNNFSVSAVVFGTIDDGNGLDKFRYMITDATGKALYVEDTTRRVGYADGAFVINLAYQNGTPAKNPVTFGVYELDSSGNQKNSLSEANYNAPCLASASGVTRSGIFTPPEHFLGTVLSTTRVYGAPNANPLDQMIYVNQQYNILYRSVDATWVAIFVGGNDLVWVPISTIAADPKALTTPPTRIDGSSLTPSVTASAASPTFNHTVVTTSAVRLHAQPSAGSAVLDYLPRNTTLTVIGRDTSGWYLKVTVNGMIGWIARNYAMISSSDLRNLPVAK